MALTYVNKIERRTKDERINKLTGGETLLESPRHIRKARHPLDSFVTQKNARPIETVVDPSVDPLALPTVVAVVFDFVSPAGVQLVAEDVKKLGVVRQDPDIVTSDDTLFDNRSSVVLSFASVEPWRAWVS